MKEIYLIRHGKTAGNMEKRYVGSTDEPLCEEGVCEIKERRNILLRSFLPENERGGESQMAMSVCNRQPKKVYVSPMLRCRQTAELLFPGVEQQIVDDLREMDFGEFEYKNYKELANDVRYQAFIDSGGSRDFPGAETQQQFKYRIRRAFQRCIKNEADSMNPSELGKMEGPMVFVVHGGVIMAIMEACAKPHRNYFDWQVGTVEGYRCRLGFEDEEIYFKQVERIGSKAEG